MEVIFFILAVVTLVSTISLNNDDTPKVFQAINPALQNIPISSLLKSTPRNGQAATSKESPKQFPGCGISTVSEEGSGPKIYGGEDAMPNEFPWQALILVQNSAGFTSGGGALINPYWVLTAGHLTFGGISGNVQLGSYNRTAQDPGQVNTAIEEFVTHPQYQGVDHNDIGLIKLVNPAPSTESIRPICLPAYSDFVGGGMSLTITGWGRISSTESPVILQKASVTSMTTADCTATGLINIDDTKICTTAAPGTGLCVGDSGGPLGLASGGITYSVGIASFIVNECGGSYPNGFTRTTAYLSWISSTTGIAIDP